MPKATDYLRGLTQNHLQSILDYDSTTGLFVWKRNQGKAKKGVVAGKKHPQYDYILIGVHGYHYLAHRLAWFWVHGRWPKEDIDHVNRIQNDNRLCNLREATKSDNLHNAKMFKTNISGYKGAHLDRRDGYYYPRIMVQGTVHHLGRAHTPQEANKIYAKAARRLAGEFARSE